MNTPLTDPVLRRVAAADPAPVTDLTATEAIRAEALLARLESTPRATASAARPARRTRLARLTGTLRTRLVAAAATAAAIAGVAILVPTSASADVVLLQAADAAALQPHATGEYWYTHWQIQDQLPAGPTDPLHAVTYQREDWVSHERFVSRDEVSGALRALEAGTTTIDPNDVRVLEFGIGEDGNRVTPTFAGLTWDQLAALPTDPAALRTALLDATPPSGNGRDYDLWSVASQLLTGSPAQPELRRALWQVLAGIPDVSLLGSRTDALGREGTAVEARFDDWSPTMMVLDPATGALLEYSYTNPDGSYPRVFTLVEQGPRDAAPAVQPPLCGPGSVPLVSC